MGMDWIVVFCQNATHKKTIDRIELIIIDAEKTLDFDDWLTYCVCTTYVELVFAVDCETILFCKDRVTLGRLCVTVWTLATGVTEVSIDITEVLTDVNVFSLFCV